VSAASKIELRPLLRDRRRALRAEDPFAAQRAADRFEAAGFEGGGLLPFRIAALYRAMGSEIDPTPLGRRLAASGVMLALPVVIAADAPLVFRRAAEDAALVPDALGILAPGPEAETVMPDLIVTPLLGFDAYGGRIGQGGGFYDRTLASLRAKAQVFALGLAYDGQNVDGLVSEPHDQPLDGVLTPSGLRLFGAG
jgi:5-formyltetrahydrofolate cyclo-ligase